MLFLATFFPSGDDEFDESSCGSIRSRLRFPHRVLEADGGPGRPDWPPHDHAEVRGRQRNGQDSRGRRRLGLRRVPSHQSHFLVGW